MNPEVIRYIQQHRGTYTEEAIRSRLLEAGHPADVIDAAWRAVESGNVPAPQSEAPSQVAASGPYEVEQRDPSIFASPRFWATFVGLVLVVVGLPVIPALFQQWELFSWASLASLLLLFGGFIASIVLLATGRERPVAMGLAGAVGLIVVIPFVLYVIVAGLCIVGLGFGGFR